MEGITLEMGGWLFDNLGSQRSKLEFRCSLYAVLKAARVSVAFRALNFLRPEVRSVKRVRTPPKAAGEPPRKQGSNHQHLSYSSKVLQDFKDKV